MEHDYWSLERWRFALVLFSGFLGGLISGYWLISFIVALVVYISWLLFKLQQLHNWLERGGRASALPDSNGIWERMNYHIQRTQKISDVRKKRMGTLLKRFQGIITSLPYATIVLTTNNEIDWANKHAVNLLQVDIIKDRGQRIENLIRDPKFQKLLKKDKQKEIELSAPHNKQVTLSLQIIPIEDNLKLLIARDISERVQLIQMRKNFIANASHELRTPLTVIAGYLEMMQGDDEIPEQYRAAIIAANEQSSRMSNIIRDLLTLSRLENNEVDENKYSRIELAKIIQSICRDQTQIDKSKHIIDCSQVDEELQINGVKDEIISACSNLVHNAVRYTSAGSEIKISWNKNAKGEALYTVVDNGEGIPEEHIAHLTERFYRVDKGRSQETGGTGLGLAIVLHICQRHGAKLNIESIVGKGSMFEIVFPVERVFVYNTQLASTKKV